MFETENCACAQGFSCVNSKCLQARYIGDPCGDDQSICVFGLCKNGQCVRRQRVGETCTADTDCATGTCGCANSPCVEHQCVDTSVCPNP